MNAPQEEELFSTAFLKVFENWLSLLRHANSDHKVEQLIVESLRNLPASLTTGYDQFEIIEIKSFLQILLQKFQEDKADSRTLIRLTFEQYKNNRRTLETAMQAHQNRPRRASVKSANLSLTGSRSSVARRSGHHLPNFSKVESEPAKTSINTESTDVRDRKSVLLSAHSASGNPPPQFSLGNPPPQSPRQEIPVIKINLYGNTADVKSWFVDRMSNSAVSGNFTIIVKTDQGVRSLDVSLNQERPEPDIILALCDKRESHTDLLKQLSVQKKVTILFIRTNITNCSSAYDMSKDKLQKSNINAFFYKIEFGNKEEPAVSALQKILEKIPDLLSLVGQPKQDNSGCGLM